MNCTCSWSFFIKYNYKSLDEIYCSHRGKKPCLLAFTHKRLPCFSLWILLLNLSQLPCSHRPVLALISNTVPCCRTRLCVSVQLEKKQNKLAEGLNLELWHSLTPHNTIKTAEVCWINNMDQHGTEQYSKARLQDTWQVLQWKSKPLH